MLALGQNTVGLWERGRMVPSSENLHAACLLYRVSADWILGLSEEPQIPANHAVINREIEAAALKCDSYAELKKAAIAADSYGVEGIQFGYTIPSKFEIVPREEYEQRMSAVRHRLERLLRKGGSRGSE